MRTLDAVLRRFQCVIECDIVDHFELLVHTHSYQLNALEPRKIEGFSQGYNVLPGTELAAIRS